MTLIAPWRMWDLKSREDELKYAEAHNVPIDYQSEENPYPYSMDWNIWHLSMKGTTWKTRPMPERHGLHGHQDAGTGSGCSGIRQDRL